MNLRDDQVWFESFLLDDFTDPADRLLICPQRAVVQAGEQDVALRHAQDPGGPGRLGPAGGPAAVLIGENEEVRLGAGAYRLADECRRPLRFASPGHQQRNDPGELPQGDAEHQYRKHGGMYPPCASAGAPHPFWTR